MRVSVLIELFKVALRNIKKRKKRAILTVISIFIGVAAVVALVSLGQGLQKTINDQFEKVGADKIMVQSKEMFFGGQDVQRPMTEHEIDILEKSRGVTNAAGTLYLAGKVEYNKLQRNHFIISLPDNQEDAKLIQAFTTMEIESGRFLSHKDSGKAVIGNNLANKKLFQKNMVVGDKILVNGKLFNVIG